LPPSLREALAAAMQPAFMAAAGVAVVIFLIVFFWLREVPLREGFEEDATPVVPEATTPTVLARR
jgi:sugar phosphate permease